MKRYPVLWDASGETAFLNRLKDPAVGVRFRAKAEKKCPAEVIKEKPAGKGGLRGPRLGVGATLREQGLGMVFRSPSK